jgi:hypothetical protein
MLKEGKLSAMLVISMLAIACSISFFGIVYEDSNVTFT